MCGCTETTACQVYIIRDGEEEAIPCSWIDPSRTLCSNPDCIAKVPMDQLMQYNLKGQRVKGAA